MSEQAKYDKIIFEATLSKEQIKSAFKGRHPAGNVYPPRSITHDPTKKADQPEDFEFLIWYKPCTLQQAGALMFSYADFVNSCVALENASFEADTDVGRAMLGAIGITGEAGEVSELIKKAVFHRGTSIEDIDLDDMKKELGDVLWYLTLLADTFGLTLEEIMITNVKKLIARYKERGKV